MSSSTVNGETKCQTLKRVFRQCPGEHHPQEVYRSEQSEEGAGAGALMPAMPNPFSSFGGFFGGAADVFGGAGQERPGGGEVGVGPDDLFSMMESMLRPFGGIFQGEGNVGERSLPSRR